MMSSLAELARRGFSDLETALHMASDFRHEMKSSQSSHCRGITGLGGGVGALAGVSERSCWGLTFEGETMRRSAP